MKAKDVKVGDRLIIAGQVERVVAVETQEDKCIVLRFIRHESPFCVRTWNWFWESTELTPAD